MNGSPCVAKYIDDDYQCACSPGFKGKHCQIKIGVSTQHVQFITIQLYLAQCNIYFDIYCDVSEMYPDFFPFQAPGKDCKDIKMRGDSGGNGMYQLDPDGGSLSTAF